MDTAVTTNDEHENSRRRATVRRLRLSPTFSSLTGKWIHPLAGVLALVTTNVAAKADRPMTFKGLVLYKRTP